MPITTFTLRLLVEQPAIFQSYSGFASCGVFYNLIKAVDANLAEELHSSKKLAPWAATPIYKEFPPPRRPVYRSIVAPSIASISFTVLDAGLANVVKDAILTRGLTVELGKAEAKVASVAVSELSYAELANCDPLPEKFALEFSTPTALRRSVLGCCPACPIYSEYVAKAREGKAPGMPCKYAAAHRGATIPLPLPQLIFRNLARIWSMFSDCKLDVWSAARWAESAVVVAGFPKGIRTVRVYEHTTTNKWIAGFMGTVRFAIIKELYSKKHARAAAALLRLAEHSNVGVRRTAGLGVVRLLLPKLGEASQAGAGVAGESRQEN